MDNNRASILNYPLPIRLIVLGVIFTAVIMELGWLFILHERYEMMGFTLAGLSEKTVRAKMGNPDTVISFADSQQSQPQGYAVPAEPLLPDENLLIYSGIVHRAHVYISPEKRVRCTLITAK